MGSRPLAQVERMDQIEFRNYDVIRVRLANSIWSVFLPDPFAGIVFKG